MNRHGLTTATVLDSPREESPAMRLLNSYMDLVKARLSLLVLWTTAVGFILAADQAGLAVDVVRLLWTLLGTAGAAWSANALNQVLEQGRDERMSRTSKRPLPAGRLSRAHAVALAFILGAVGVFVLARFVNAYAAGLAFITIIIYVLLYTPLKTRSTLNTLVGAICGAIPPMIGWVAAAGTATGGAWVLAALLFVWQIPHFLALAWLYRADYALGGFVMLPHYDRSGRMTCRIVVLTSLLLLPLALTATLLGLAGWFYTAGSIALGAWLLSRAIRLHALRTDASARRVFLASIVYLSAVLLLLLADRGPIGEPTVHRVAAAPPAASLPAGLPVQ